MTMNTSKSFFLISLIFSTLIVMSSNSWFSAWMALEINLLTFISLITNPSNMLASEAALKYFLVQTLASTSLLLFILIYQILEKTTFNDKTFSSLISATLLFKLGAAPFHFWFPSIMEGLSWLNCFILITWQKIAPLTLLSNLNKNLFFSTSMTLSIIVGSLGSLNQLSLRKLMAYSSISHLGWLMAAMTINSNLWYIYLITYILVNLALILSFSVESSYYMSQFMTTDIMPKMKFILFSNLLSLGGLPPFLGFLPKWLVIQHMSLLNTITITMMVVLTLMTLYVYMRLTFLAYLFFYPHKKWSKKTPIKYPILMTSMSIISLPTISLLSYHL